MSAGADDLQTLIEIWNADSGNLRKVRDIDAAKNTPELQRLTRAVVKRHGREKAHALFRQGIPAVANAPHWLGSRADKPSRPGAPYGILGYLRHVEEKAEAAASLTESPPPRPHRPWEVDFFAQRKDDLRVEQIDELLAGEQARMSNGEVWDLGECDLCNN